jgi:hypothetical protein
MAKNKPTENRRNNNNLNQKGTIDKKYEIKSMEELFIEEEPKIKEGLYQQNVIGDPNQYEEQEQQNKFNEYLYVDENNNLLKNTYNLNENVDFENLMEKYGEFYQENFIKSSNDTQSIAESLPVRILM